MTGVQTCALPIYDIGGVRIEDLVLITETGIENFCTMPKDIEVP